jgi:hypothetical protein
LPWNRGRFDRFGDLARLYPENGYSLRRAVVYYCISTFPPKATSGEPAPD